MLTPVFILGLLFGLITESHGQDNKLVVDLGYAKYNGFVGEKGMNQWFGIRYAAPPTGNNRFREPQDPADNPEVQQANKRTPVCHSSPSTKLNPDQSEDCLFLNVFAPAKETKPRAVLVWFQGGGLNSNADANGDGSSLIAAADNDLVVVTFNFRVGVHGFLASKEVKKDGNLNAGLLDQRKVLHWVQKNIHLFGGDPERVTIGGGSAGGGAVSLHLTAYGGKNENLFSAAVGESASYGVQYTVEESQYQYDALVKRVKCDKAPDTLKCLRDLDIKTLSENNPNVPVPGGGGGTPVYMWSNHIDGDFTPDWSYNLYETGKFVKVPVIFGACSNEGTTFTPKNLANQSEIDNFMKNNYPKLTEEDLATAASLYPVPDKPEYPDSTQFWRPLADMYGHMRYNCPGLYMSGSYPRVGGMNTSWSYRWDVARPANLANGNGVTHVAEGGAVWGSYKKEDPESALQPIIQSYWTSFIRSHDPNTHRLKDAPEWLGYTEGEDSSGANRRMLFVNDPKKVAIETIIGLLQKRCKFWHSIGAKIGQ
ncbi:alpha/beta-Hydrolase [Glarea lozoyensis ATCC 20868]|uniref:Carboxylic ester hydrolase n=1 Tax=Glarea lozoyensis (strain ATCC 20868 / MF5171) TaxID=1116229 RepID=S3DY35_GLAL2|nr:alpha/beta-Hydrolase [Glarea lozoyensis ATCC 20868]EPE31258.1 alpha/beta-Hydrolase [Glarea lozoyensis ATCC 20868]